MTSKTNVVNLILFYYLPGFLWALVIFHASSYQTAQVTPTYWQEFIVKKIAHLIVYSILTTISYRALRKTGFSNSQAAFIAIFITFVYGLSDEIHQRFTPKRESTFRDAIIDTIGGISTIYIIWRLLPKAPKRLSNLAKKLELL